MVFVLRITICIYITSKLLLKVPIIRAASGGPGQMVAEQLNQVTGFMSLMKSCGLTSYNGLGLNDK